MELRRELLTTIGALVLLCLVLAFGAIGLFVRMGPAIERILQENVYSIVAAEEILAEFAASGDAALSTEGKARVSRALEKARENVTEDAERPVLDSLEGALKGAMDGNVVARRSAIDDVRKLISINREAMISVDQEAQRLGTAGAWAAVFIGFLAFTLSLLVVVRIQKRFVRPLEDLYDVLEEARQGNQLRRCRISDAPREVVRVTESVNRLLDERLSRETKLSTR